MKSCGVVRGFLFFSSLAGKTPTAAPAFALPNGDCLWCSTRWSAICPRCLYRTDNIKTKTIRRKRIILYENLF